MPSTSTIRWPLILALLVAVVVAGAGAVSFIRALDTFQPLGFEAEREAASWRVTSVSTPATGLALGDQILSVVAGPGGGGEAVGTAELLRSAPESELLVLRGDELVTVTYQRPPVELDWVYLLLALVGSLHLLIGCYTALRHRGPPAALFCLWCAASAALFLVTPSGLGDGTGRVLYGVEELGRLFLPALTLHLFFVFPRPLKAPDAPPGSRRQALRWVAFLYLPAAVLLALQVGLIATAGRSLSPRAVAAALPWLDRIELGLLGLYALTALTVFGLRLARRRGLVEHRQLLWVAVGLVAGYLPFLTLYLIPWTLGLETPGLVHLLAVGPLVLVPMTFAWAVLRFRLWDIGVIVRDAVSTALTVLLAAGLFSLAHLTVSRSIPQSYGLLRDFLTFGSGLSIAALLLPARRRVSTLFERFQYGHSLTKRRALERLGHELLHQRDLDRLVRELLEDVQEGLDLTRVALYLTSQEGVLTRVGPVDELAEDDPDGSEPWAIQPAPSTLPAQGFGTRLWEREVSFLDSLQPEDAARFSTGRSSNGAGEEGLVPSATTARIRQRLFAAGYRSLFPLVVQDLPLGILAVGHRVGEQPLSSDDVELVRQIMDGAALALENARLVHQLHHQLDEVGRLQRFSESIIESSPAGIVVLGPDGRIFTANRVFGRLLGELPSALVGRSAPELLGLGELPRRGDGLLEVAWTAPDGSERHLQLSTAGFSEQGLEGHDLDGAPALRAGDPLEDDALTVLLVHDVTERVAMEKALREKDRLAALGLLAAGVAHEVNTPITGISSYAQMLLEDTPQGDPRRSLLEKVERQTFRASKIVNNLLDFARDRESERRPVDLVPLLRETLDLLHERRSRRGVRLELDLPEAPLEVLGRDGELQQVFTNLALNALDAMCDAGGVLRVEAGLADDPALGPVVRVVVADTGPGIAADRLDKIFEPLYSTKLSRGGTGLGLSITRDLVTRHEGAIRVDSALGEGARFEVRLPRLVEADGEAEGGTEGAPDHRDRGGREDRGERRAGDGDR